MKVPKVLVQTGLHLRKPLAGVPLFLWLLAATLIIFLAVVVIKTPLPWTNPGWAKLLAREQMKLTECIPIGIWLGAAVNLVALLVLAPLMPLLARLSHLPVGANYASAAIIPAGLGYRVIFTLPRLLGLAAILLLALGLRLPSLPDSTHRDEQDTLRRNTFGYEEERKDGTFKFKKKNWTDVLWENGGANNPVFYSICSRLSLQVVWDLTDLPRNRFSIVAARFPSLVAGVLSIAAIWTLLMALEMRAPAWVAGLLGALHPLHVDYSAEARGYGFVLLFTVLQVLFLLPALRGGRWRWWVAYGLSQFLLLYSNPGSLYFPLVVNVYVLGLLLWRWWTSRAPAEDTTADLRRAVALAQFWRAMIVNLISGLLYIGLMAPCVPQILNYFKITGVRGGMGTKWILHTMAQYTTGLFLELPEMPDASAYLGYYIRTELAIAHPMLTSWIVYIMPIFLVLGLIAIWRQGTFPRLIAVCTLLPPILCYLHHQKLTGLYLYYWYVIFALPFLLMAWGTGLTLPFKSLSCRLRNALSRQPEDAPVNAAPLPLWQRYTWLIIPALILPFYAFITHEGRQQLRTGSGKPYVQIMRGSYAWHVFPDGRMVRYLPKTRPAHEPDGEHSPARAQEGGD